ncbi:MAG: rod shape-determining protein MreD [Deltaproteobacteria bacterium]|nr:rod shape-determining protein MreD [Deltaproteobacteria bacterium]
MMRSVLTFSALLLLGLLVQATLVHSLFPSAVAPDFLLMLVFFLGIHHKSPMGAFGAFLLGVTADFASARFIGPNAAGAVIAFAFVATSSGHMFAERGVISGILAFFASIVKSIVFLVMMRFYAGISFPIEETTTVLLEALFTGILTPIALGLLQPTRSSSFMRRLENEGHR